MEPGTSWKEERNADQRSNKSIQKKTKYSEAKSLFADNEREKA